MTESVATREDDARWMDAALALGRRNLGLTAPNPAVGAILVKDGVAVGAGATAPEGRPHAERLALEEAGEAARGATLYVTLEPCSHEGRSGPCADAVIAAGVTRVVSAMEDPNPDICGEGHARLRAAGVTLDIGCRAEEARRAHRGHILRVTRGRPMVTLKLAETADGYAAGAPNDPRLRITGPIADARVQVMRSLHEAVMIGVGTALADDAMLTVRLPGLDQRPLRVVLDTHLSLPPRSRLATTAREFPTLVVAGHDAVGERADALAALGVEIVGVKRDDAGHADIGEALQALGQLGLTRVFSEGGPRIAAELIALGLADAVAIFTSLKPLGREGHAALTPEARATLADPSRYAQIEEADCGPDRLRVFERLV